MQPSDSPASFGLGSGSPRRRPTAVRPLVLGRLARATATGGRWRVVSGSPWHRFSTAEMQGPPRLLGRPPLACRGHPPRRVRRRHHPWQDSNADDTAVFKQLSALDTPALHSFEAATPRPTCSRAYASPPPLPDKAQGSLPACRAQLWPGGICTRWTTYWVSRHTRSLQTSLAWSLLNRCVNEIRRPASTFSWSMSFRFWWASHPGIVVRRRRGAVIRAH